MELQAVFQRKNNNKAMTKASLTETNDSDGKLSQMSFLRTSSRKGI